MKPIHLEALAEQLDCMFDEWLYYLNKKTGEIIELQMEYFNIAEELEGNDDLSSYSDWEQEEIKEAMDVLENYEDYIDLPNKFQINEYSIMEQFSYNYPDSKIRNKLCSTIHGSGAFRRFKDTVIYCGIEDEWYSYKKTRLIEIAKEWCEDNHISYIDEQS